MSGTGREARPPQARVLGDEWGKTRASQIRDAVSYGPTQGHASLRQLKLRQRTWVAIDYTGQKCQTLKSTTMRSVARQAPE